MSTEDSLEGRLEAGRLDCDDHPVKGSQSKAAAMRTERRQRWETLRGSSRRACKLLGVGWGESNRGGQEESKGRVSNLPCHLFCTAKEVTNFSIFKWWRGSSMPICEVCLEQSQAHQSKQGVSVSATTAYLTSDNRPCSLPNSQSLLPFPSPGKLSKVLRKLDTDGIKRNREIICQYMTGQERY